MNRRRLSLLVLGAAFLLVLWFAADVALAVFAGILFAVFLRGCGNRLASWLNIRNGLGLALFCVFLALALTAFLGIAGAALAQQMSQLVDRLPAATESVRDYVQSHGWARSVIDNVDFQNLLPSGSRATTFFSSSLGAFGNLIVVTFVGIYGAAAPQTYLRGFTALFAPSLRPKVRAILTEAGIALRGWLKAQFVSMAVVGLLTGLGLFVLGVPLAPILAVLAAILTFIPNIGPVLAAIPAVLLGLSDGLSTALWIVGLYVVVQTVESYLVTPRVQEETVSLPPALTISVQLLFGVVFGILGLAMATPLAAAGLRVGQLFYVKGYLDEEKQAAGD
ncbi:AI-2E family transporter [Fulvimarina endophytica]|uniref:AI-2E family transporter n=1 Tax=Fulvimarina endophytica TaxID=2293836 RepID=A0A371X7T5_9HYPH|nr:AI-2E family transporter [Fulvimarina endophytica]RFC65280.1 AI-2E family transporter [Fulvimarina endophytica]